MNITAICPKQWFWWSDLPRDLILSGRLRDEDNMSIYCPLLSGFNDLRIHVIDHSTVSRLRRVAWSRQGTCENGATNSGHSFSPSFHCSQRHDPAWGRSQPTTLHQSLFSSFDLPLTNCVCNRDEHPIIKFGVGCIEKSMLTNLTTCRELQSPSRTFVFPPMLWVRVGHQSGTTIPSLYLHVLPFRDCQHA